MGRTARGRVRLATWVKQWRESERHALRPTTLARDEIYLRTRVIPTFGDIPLARVEHQDVQEWVNELSTIYAPTTVHKCHQILRKVMTAAVKNRMIARNPCDGVQLPRIEREMRFLTPGQVSELADAIDPRYRSFVLVGAYGGLRLGEMTGLPMEPGRPPTPAGRRGRDLLRDRREGVLRPTEDQGREALGTSS